MSGKTIERCVVGLVVAGSMFTVASPAHAMPHRLCLYFEIGDEYWDASPRASDGMEFYEEYGRNAGALAFPAQRRLARIRDESTGEVVWGWRPLGGWAPQPGDPVPGCSCGPQPPPPDPGDAGCADFELDDPSTTLTVEWTRWAIWDDPEDPTAPNTGNQIIGYNCDETMTVCEFEIPVVYGVPADPAGETALVIPFPSEYLEPIDLPLWAITFAEDRFAALGEQPLEGTRFYVGYDQANVLPGHTQADRTFGNQPSVVIAGDSWHGKFVAAHEYGHQQTMAAIHAAFGPSDLNYCFDPATYPATTPTCEGPQHLVFSSEWQGAAAIEGLAHWYSVAAWNDVDDEECGVCTMRTQFVRIEDSTTATAYDVPRGSPVCPALVGDPCPAGVGNEHDWVSALRMFRLSGTRPDFWTMFRMIATYYGSGAWVTADPSDAFWTGFDQEMAGHLGAGYPDWQAAAQAWRLER